MKDREEACSFDGIDDFGVKSLLTPLYEPRGGGRGGGGWVQPIMAYIGRLPPKGVRQFRAPASWEGREICHYGL